MITMLKKSLVLVGILSFGSVWSAYASITINIQEGGFEDGSGNPTNGMSIGILVDTSSDGFLPGSYIGWDLSLNGQFLETSSGATDDWFVYSGSLGSGQTPPVTISGGPVGDGSVGTIKPVSYSQLSESDPFLFAWFPSNSASDGSLYGLASAPEFVIPPDGNANTAPTTFSTKTPNFTAIPEPSAYTTILGFLGLGYAICSRRRRSSSQV